MQNSSTMKNINCILERGEILRKFISALLLIILFVSIFLNVSMLYQDYKSTPNNGDIKGSYELFMVDIRAAQTSLNTYFEETDEKKETTSAL